MDEDHTASKQSNSVQHRQSRSTRSAPTQSGKRSLPPRHSFLTDAVEAVLQRESQVWEPCIDGDTVLCITDQDTASAVADCVDKQGMEPTILDTAPETPTPLPVFSIIDRKEKEKNQQPVKMDEVPDDEFYTKRHRRHEREEKRQKNREKEQLLHDMYQQQQFIDKVKAADKSMISAIAASLRQQETNDDSQESSSASSPPPLLDGDTIYRKILQNAEDQMARFEALGLLKRKGGKKSDAKSPSPPLPPTTSPFDAASPPNAISTYESIPGSASRTSRTSASPGFDAVTLTTNGQLQQPSSSRKAPTPDTQSKATPAKRRSQARSTSNARSKGKKRSIETTDAPASKPAPKERITSFAKNERSSKGQNASSSRRSSRYATAFGQRIPPMDEGEFTLPHHEYGSLMYDRLRKYV